MHSPFKLPELFVLHYTSTAEKEGEGGKDRPVDILVILLSRPPLNTSHSILHRASRPTLLSKSFLVLEKVGNILGPVRTKHRKQIRARRREMGELELEWKGDGAERMKGRGRSDVLLSNVGSHILVQIIDVHKLLERSVVRKEAKRRQGQLRSSRLPARRLFGKAGERTNLMM